MGDADNNNKGSIANGTIDREARSKCWYAAYVQIKCEKKSAQKLESLGYETFVPVQTEIRQWSDRKKEVERVIIPMVVFLKADFPKVKDIERLSFIHSFLRYPGAKDAAIIPEDQIERLKFMLGNCESTIVIEPFKIIKGAKVRVARGCLRGIEGQISKDETNGYKLYITIDNLACASVILDINDVELL